MSVSVVVSTYSEDKLNCVLDCVESLGRQSVLPYEVFLVVDPLLSLAEFYRSRLPSHVRVVMSSGFGLSNARNAGVKSAQGDVVAFIDDDAVADRNWLRNLVQGYDDPSVVGVGGRALPVWEGGLPAWFPAELNWIVGCSYKGLPEHKARVRNPIGCNMSFRKGVFDSVGYFRTDIGRFGKVLLAGEEPEFSLRVFRMFPDSKIVYEPGAVVYHKVPRTRRRLTYFLRRSFYEGVSKALILPEKTSRGRGLSTENEYLKYLMDVAVPSKVKRAYRLENLSHLMIMSVSTFMVFLGFSVGKLAH